MSTAGRVEGGEGDVAGAGAGRGQVGDVCTRELAQEGTPWKVVLPGGLSLHRAGH